MQGIKYILLDWGGTIGISGCRRHFVSTGKGVQQGALDALKRFKLPLGILSNTEVTDKQMAQGLRKAGVSRMFPVQIYSSDRMANGRVSCSKPCRPIFERAWQAVKKHARGIRKDQVLYVGNNYFHDIVPAWRFGFKTALVSNGDDDFIFRLANIAGVQDISIQHVAELPLFV